MNFEHFKYNRASLPADANERQEYIKKLKQEFSDEIKNSETATEYFAKYQPNSIENFIKTYTEKKVHLLECYEFYSHQYYEKENSELHYYKNAEEMLQLILQKKLFNMQLRWRAGQLEIDDIDIAYDFQFHEKHISSCTFIPKITAGELELMKEYLLRFDEDDEVEDRYMNWQDYDSITGKNEYGDMDNLPDWYDFYDSRMGTRMLLLLPNLRGEKEEFYMGIARRNFVAANPIKTIPVQLPYLYGLRTEIFEFSKLFEKDKYFSALFKYYNYYEEKDNQSPNYEEIKDTIRYLLTADRPIYLKSHLTWDKALITAAKEYKNTRIVEALDIVYEEYLMMKDMGLFKDKSPEEVKKEYDKDFIVKLFREKILEGRVQNGEPKDFSY